jgi:hypothetical protein
MGFLPQIVCGEDLGDGGIREHLVSGASQRCQPARLHVAGETPLRNERSAGEGARERHLIRRLLELAIFGRRCAVRLAFLQRQLNDVLQWEKGASCPQAPSRRSILLFPR